MHPPSFLPVCSRAKANALPLRIYSMLACPDRSIFCGTNSSLVPSGGPVPWETHDGAFVLRSVKLVADGALGSEGAAMHEPYAGREEEGWRGLLLIDEARLGPLVSNWVEHGWQVVRPF
jgi:predicted amidohydrolase YtcJ